MGLALLKYQYEEPVKSSRYFRPRPEMKYTYADYAAWELPPRKRYELYHGRAFAMAAPSIAHQTILLNLGVELSTFLKNKTCRAFVAPVDVRLFPREDRLDTTVVQPDVMVVCDPKKLSAKTCDGAPDFIAEILSHSTRRSDLLNKLNLYEEAGVREYWIIDPELKTIQQYILSEAGYIAHTFGEGEVPVHIFDGELKLSFDNIFVRT
ncbi:MAG: Uma2 family endonuclease [Spirochaetaceae bacterium]|jgi:Uma2 family endonuclease|nr:Uma2 family endonuclease [Spirochaetaceae bacterium]